MQHRLLSAEFWAHGVSSDGTRTLYVDANDHTYTKKENSQKITLENAEDILICYRNKISGRRLHTLYSDHIFLWDLDTGYLLGSYLGELRIADDDRYAIQIHGSATVWDLDEKKQISQFGFGMTYFVCTNGPYLVVTAFNTCSQVWEFMTGTLLYTLPKMTYGKIQDHYLITSFGDVVDVRTGKKLYTINIDKEMLKIVANQKYILITTSVAQLFDIRNGQLLATIPTTSWCFHLAISNSYAIVLKQRWLLYVYDINNKTSCQIKVSDNVNKLSITEDGRLLVLTSSGLYTYLLWSHIISASAFSNLLSNDGDHAVRDRIIKCYNTD